MIEKRVLYLTDPSVIQAESREPREVVTSSNPVSEILPDEYGYRLAGSTGQVFIDGQVFTDIPNHSPLVRTRTGSWHAFNSDDSIELTRKKPRKISDPRADYRAFLNRQIHEFNERVKKREA